MTPRTRTILLAAVAAVAVFTVGVLTGYAVGRSRSPDAVAATSSSPSPSSAASTLPPAVAIPSAGQAPAVGTEGRVLAEGTRAVVAMAPNAQCGALITAGVLGECGEVPVAGNRVVWVVESTPTTTATRAFTVRVFTFVPDESGWVEWLRAEDASGARWTDVGVVARDLTSDGVPELVAAFRGQGDTEALSVDVVSYTEVGVPVVVAHMPDADHGSLAFATGGFDLFAARYPANEPACCPPVFSRQSVAYVDGFFRIAATQDVSPNAVPASQV